MTTQKSATRVPIIARRMDGYGFMLGRLVDVERIHGHRVYTIKTLTGRLMRLSAKQYSITSHEH